jgi:hypothetical protein
VPRREIWLLRREMEDVRVKSWSEREVVRAWNSGSSAYWGSSERRHVVGWAGRVLVGVLLGL